MGIFERYLSVWVALAMIAGLAGGSIFPSLFATLGSWEYANINFVIAVLIWLMIYPMMMQIDFTAVKNIHRRPKGLIVTLTVNWLDQAVYHGTAGDGVYSLPVRQFYRTDLAGTG